MILRLARVTMLLSAAVLAVTLVANAQSKDPFVGTWQLNVAKSKYSPGPTPKSITSMYEAAGQGYKVSVTNESPSGTVQYGYTTNLDGKDSPVTGNNPNADTVAVRRIDAHTLESVSKKGGKVTITQRNVLSADGKSRTVTTTGTDAQGQKVNNVRCSRSSSAGVEDARLVSVILSVCARTSPVSAPRAEAAMRRSLSSCRRLASMAGQERLSLSFAIRSPAASCRCG